jgi:hypothetical protein
MKTVTYLQDSGELDKDRTKAWAWRLTGRLELCAGWMWGELPTLTYFNPRGMLHPGAVALTLRIGRAMIGWRWYAPNEKDKP